MNQKYPPQIEGFFVGLIFIIMHDYFGKKFFDRTFEKLLNRVINSYLHNVTNIDFDYDFKVKSRHATDDEYYDWIIEIHTDTPIPRTFEYNDEYKKKKKVDGFHNSVFSSEIKDLLVNMGVNTDPMRGNSVGIKFMNLK